MGESFWPWESGAGSLVGVRLDPSPELGRAVGEETLDRRVENVGKHQGIIEGRDLLARLPTGDLSARSMAEETRDVALRKLPLLSVAPETVRDGPFMSG